MKKFLQVMPIGANGASWSSRSSGVATGAEGEPGRKKTALRVFREHGLGRLLLPGTSIVGTHAALQYHGHHHGCAKKAAPHGAGRGARALMAEGNLRRKASSCATPTFAAYLAHDRGRRLRLRHAGYESTMIGALEAGRGPKESFKVERQEFLVLSLLGNVAPCRAAGHRDGHDLVRPDHREPQGATPGDAGDGRVRVAGEHDHGPVRCHRLPHDLFFFKNKVTKMTLSINLQAVDMLKHLAPSEAH